MLVCGRTQPEHVLRAAEGSELSFWRPVQGNSGPPTEHTCKRPLSPLISGSLKLIEKTVTRKEPSPFPELRICKTIYQQSDSEQSTLP